MGVSNSTGGVNLQATATLDKTIPSGFTVTPDQSIIDAVAVSSTGFTLTVPAKEVGDQYSYTISSVGASPVIAESTVTGTVTSATHDLPESTSRPCPTARSPSR